ncbi:MAG: SGNH/GDSL hydrolase family protein [Micromonosporaceae bacterium]
MPDVTRRIPRLSRWLAALVGASTVFALALPAAAAPAPLEVGTWGASPVAGANLTGCPAGDGGVVNQTVRNVVFTSVAGSEVRVRLTNAFGTAPLTIGAASIAIDNTTAAGVLPDTIRTLHFGGRASVTIPPGAEALSDWVDLDVPQLQDIAVSVYVPSLTGAATFHRVASQNNFLSGPGDFTTSASAADFPTVITCWMFVDGIDVAAAPTIKGSVVTLGDSITDGTRSTPNANHRWPNFLARRLLANGGRSLSVVDEGISGNRVLSDAGTAGVSALARLNRDVLSQPNARDAILLEGINDIGQSDLGNTPLVTADDLIAAYKQIIERAHAAGLRIFGATLTPFKGAFYWSPQGELTREAVNDWILHSGAFDGTIDFAAATADPNDPQVFNPIYDSGDHLHPNDLGYEVMADTVNLHMLLQR